MKLKYKFLSIVILFFSILIINSISIYASSLSFVKGDTIVSGTISNGVTYENFIASSSTDSGSSGNQNVSYVKMEQGSAEVVAWAYLTDSGTQCKTVIDIAKDYESKNPGYTVLAGINGDYFYNNTPINALVSNGDVIKFNNHTKYQSLAITKNADDYYLHKTNEVSENYFLTIYDTTGMYPIKEVVLNGKNIMPNSNQTTFFYKYNSPMSSANVDLYEVETTNYFNIGNIFIKGKVVRNIDSTTTNACIATTDKELSDLLKKNPVVRIQQNMDGLNNNYDNIVGVGSQPLKDGQIKEASLIGDQNLDFVNERHPRSSIGFTQNGDLVIAAFDGRQTSMSGVTLREEAKGMQLLGCINAYNFDGGGSTELIIRGNNGFEYLNSPSDATPRKVVNAILIVKPDVKVDINVSEYTDVTAKGTMTYSESENVQIIDQKILLNGLEQNVNINSFELEGLKIGEANYISVITTYTKNGVNYKRSFETCKLYTTEIGVTPPVEKTKPTNFDIKFVETKKGFDAIITCDDPQSTLTKAYLISDNQKIVTIKDSRGRVASFSSLTEKHYEFSIVYYYMIDTIEPVDETLEQTFSYDFKPTKPSITSVDTKLSEDKSKLIVTPNITLNNVNIKSIILKIDGNSYLASDNVITVLNVPKNDVDYTIEIEYSFASEYGDITRTYISDNFLYQPQKTGCQFGLINILYLFIPIGVVSLLMNKRKI